MGTFNSIPSIHARTWCYKVECSHRNAKGEPVSAFQQETLQVSHRPTLGTATSEATCLKLLRRVEEGVLLAGLGNGGVVEEGKGDNGEGGEHPERDAIGLSEGSDNRHRMR